jgi:biopolymer transport protein TolR
MAEINVVPYIDVMLVLLIIFMITAPLLERGVDVELPQAASAPVDVGESEPFLVSVDRAGDYYVTFSEYRGEAVDADRMAALVTAVRQTQPDVQVLVSGDRAVKYGLVVQAMAMLQAAGVDRVGLLTEAPDER